MPATRVLLVEPDAGALSALRQAIGVIADVDAYTAFSIARVRLLHCAYDRLIVNLRLQSYNGLHLVYLAEASTRSIVYARRRESAVLRDIQSAGAFFESYETLLHALPSYIENALPPRDRRASVQLTRRAAFRGGRRASDVAMRFPLVPYDLT